MAHCSSGLEVSLASDAGSGGLCLVTEHMDKVGGGECGICVDGQSKYRLHSLEELR